MLHAALLSLAILSTPATEKVQPATNVKDPVCKMAVDAKSTKVAVRGREYRVCSRHCAEALQKDPDKYLEPDGSLKAARAK